MIPVVNPSEEPIIAISNGGRYVFPPASSKQYWRVDETAASVGQSPYKAVAFDTPTQGCVRGPIVSVPVHVANELKMGSNMARGCHKLVIGVKAQEIARDEAERFNKLRAEAEEQLIKARAELAEAKAELEARYAPAVKAAAAAKKE